MNKGVFEVGKTYLATNCLKRDDKRILALTERNGNKLTFALVSGVVTGYADETPMSAEFASQIFIDDMPFVVASSISPSLEQLETANEALKKARAAV